MKTNLRPSHSAALVLAAALITFDALGQNGVWVAHGTNHNWGKVISSADGTKLASIAFDDPYYYVSSLFTSSDSGSTWTLRDGSHYWVGEIAGSADGAKLVAAADSKLWLSTDSGATWNISANSPIRGYTGLASSSDGTRLIAIGGQIWTSSDAGLNWASHNFGDGTHSALDVACSTDGSKAALAPDGDKIYTSTDYGTNWSPRAGGSTNHFFKATSSADGAKLVAADNRYAANAINFYISSDSGTNWSVAAFGTNLVDWAAATNGTTLVAAIGIGTTARIYRSTDGGFNWTVISDTNYWAAVASSADGNKLVAAVRGGQIYTYTVPVSNDFCSNAIALTAGVTYTMDTTYATSTADPTPACQAAFGKGVWFKYSAASSSPLSISTCGSSFDTVLQIYSGACGSLTPVLCNDDNGPACTGTAASVTFTATGGTTYYILAGGYNSYGGTLKILAQLANDQCSGALPLVSGVTYSMSTADATSLYDPQPVCGSNVGKGVWFTFTPATSRVVEINTCGSDFDTVVQVYTGACGSLSTVANGCNDDTGVCGNGRQSQVAFSASAGTVYYIFVGGYNNAYGNLSLTANDVPIAITQQPSGGTANAGDVFTFNVSAIGTGLSYQWQWNTVNYYGANTNSFTLTDLDPTMAGNYRVIVSNIYGAVTSVVAVLSVDPALPLALDNTSLTWTTGGDNGAWYRETYLSSDGVDAARCLGSSGSPPWLQTTVTGPGTLTFYWGFAINLFDTTTDYLALLVDGVETAKRAASRRLLSLNSETIYLASGNHTVRWAYDRNGGDLGAAYVDQVSYVTGGTPAFVATQPAPQTALAGSNATFNVTASGTPPFTYQWRFVGANILNATNSTLLLTNVQPIQGSNYSVVVANAYGSPATSSDALLTVTSLPLPVALDYSAPMWSTTGSAAWFGEVSVSHDGIDAAQSGWLTNSQQCTINASLVGPGNLSFWWKVSSETNWDFLHFYTNGTLVAKISGEVDWQHQTVALPPGKNTLLWIYVKDASLSIGRDAGWVDQIVYDGPPYLSITPLSSTRMKLFWPYTVTGYTLQTSTNLTSPSAWQTALESAFSLGDDWVVTNNNTTGVPLFYRLKK